jgi:NADPH:quinone reductase-like Zn-dependent oxidoreductase
MKAAVVEALGRPPVYADFSDPSPRDGAVVVTVEASALTNLTRGLISGNHYASKEIQLPVVAGVDGVGRLADGRLVYTRALAPFGMMAERALIDPDAATPLPETIDPVTAAAIPNPGLSAWMSLDYAAAVKPGSHVLVLGATGVTGSVAVQLAKSVFGAQRVVAAGRNVERLQWLRSVGADDVIALGEEDLGARVAAAHAEQPFDAVLDYLWGEPAEKVLTALGANQLAAEFHATRFVQIGAMAGPTMNVPAGVLRSAGITLSGLGMGSVPVEVLIGARNEGLPRLLAMVAAGELQIETKQRALAEVADAWSSPEPSGTRVVLTP